MYKNGWVKLERKILENGAIKDGDYLSVYAFLLITGEFSQCETEKRIRVSTSLGEISRRLNIERTKVYRIIKHLKSCNLLETESATDKNHRQSLVFIKLADFSKSENATLNEHKVQQNEEQREEKRKVAKEKSREKRINKEIENNPPLPPFNEREESSFNKFWELYPKKMRRTNAFYEFINLGLTDSELDYLLTQLKKHKNSKQWQDSQYIPLPENYLRMKRWTDELEASISSFEVDDFFEQALKRSNAIIEAGAAKITGN